MEDQEKPNILADAAKNAAKNGAKSIASKGAKAAVKVLLPILPWILLVVVAVVLVGSVFNVFVSVGQTVADFWQDFITSITSPSGTIELSDEKILEFIDQIEKETHVTLNSLKLAGDIEDYSNPDRQAEIEKANIKYVKKFLEAQIATQEVERPGVPGRVFAYRTDKSVKNASEGIKLTYKTLKEFNALLEYCKEYQSEEIKNYFTLNELGEIVVAGINTTIIDVDGIITKEKDYYTTPINYKSLISQYATPAQFFIYLGEIVQNPEFLAAVTDLIKEDTEIRVTMLENTKTTVTKEVYTYTLHTKQVQRDPVTGEVIEEHIDPVTGETVGGITYTSQNVTTTTTITQINTNITPAVTYVNTWQIEQTMTYEKNEVDEPTQTITTGQGDIPAIPDESASGEPDSYLTDQVKTTTINIKNENFESTHTSDYIYKAGEKPDKHPEYTSFVDLLDEKFKIPNSSRKEAAGTNFKSGAEWLFTLLAQDTGTQNMEAFMKYVMYKYTGKSYGVTDLDFGVFDVNYSNSYNSGIYGNSIEEKVWFSLKALNLSDYAVAGAMGNIKAESGFNTEALNSSSGAYGLVQWKNPRRQKLQAYAASKGSTESDVDIQIQFLIAELTGKGDAANYADRRTRGGNGANYHTYDDWVNASSTEEAAVAYCWFFETPSTSSEKTDDIIEEENKRKQYAVDYYKTFSGKELYQGSTDSVKIGPYTFPHYLQRNYQGSYGNTTIAFGGCAPSSLAMVLAGLTNNPGITPVTVINNLNEYYGSWTNYYIPPDGTNIKKILGDATFLQRYYNVKATRYSSQEAIIANLKEGTAAIGSTPGHILAIVPVPDQYKNQGYRFYVLDSANGLSGAYRTVEEVRAKRNGSGFGFLWLIERL